MLPGLWSRPPTPQTRVQGPGGAEGTNPGMAKELAELPGSKHRWREVGSWERLDASKGSGGVASVSGEARQHGVPERRGWFPGVLKRPSERKENRYPYQGCSDGGVGMEAGFSWIPRSLLQGNRDMGQLGRDAFFSFLKMGNVLAPCTLMGMTPPRGTLMVRREGRNIRQTS